jgi:hypothetical protein
MDLLREVLSLSYDNEMTVFALFWSWWTEQNKANHAKRRLSVDEFQFVVRRHTREWKDFFRKKPVEKT